jgi:stringent starvation protein B
MANQPTSRRPYLLRAMHEWITDNGHTPHLVVEADMEGVTVPRQYVRDGKIVLNVSYSATASLLMRNDEISFSARFGGHPFEVRLPVHAVAGIYARETGQGMIFSESERDPPPTPRTPSGGDEPRRPQLKVVK